MADLRRYYLPEGPETVHSRTNAPEEGALDGGDKIIGLDQEFGNNSGLCLTLPLIHLICLTNLG